MRRRDILMGAAAALLPLAAAKGGERADGRTIMQRINRREIGGSARMTMKITLIDEAGDERLMRLLVRRRYEHGHYRTLFSLDSPDYLKGLALLLDEGPHETSMRMYFPKTGQLVPVVTRGLSALATDFTCEDVKWRFPLDDFHFTLVGHGVHHGHEVSLVEMVPRTERLGAEVGYAKAVGSVREDLSAIVRSEFLAADGNAFKVYETDDWRMVDGVWTAWRLSMRNFRARHATLITLQRVEYFADVAPAEVLPAHQAH